MITVVLLFFFFGALLVVGAEQSQHHNTTYNPKSNKFYFWDYVTMLGLIGGFMNVAGGFCGYGFEPDGDKTVYTYVSPRNYEIKRLKDGVTFVFNKENKQTTKDYLTCLNPDKAVVWYVVETNHYGTKYTSYEINPYIPPTR